MTNIKNTVNKGIQYLKSHENLDEIKIEINDFNAKRTAKSNKIGSKLIQKKDQTSESTFIKQQQHKIRLPKQIKINGGKELGIVTILSLEQTAKIKNQNPSLKLRKSNEKISSQRHAASAAKHIKNHQVHNQMDLNLNSNLADVFYVPTSTEDNVEIANGENEQMLSDQPVGSLNDYEKELQKSLIKESDDGNQKSKKTINKNEIHSTVASNANQSPIKSDKSLTNIVEPSNKATLKIDMPSEMKARHSNNPYELTTNNHVKSKSKIESTQLNDELNNDEANEELVNAIEIQNDDNSNENSEDFEGEFDENTNLNGIYHVDDLDLSDFDETSRNNRKNLMRGRDVVTRFLQIVESQHVLGGNCTAGTALNLGEGVVDRYAQDRFRIEAEVAVNRANMLSR